MATIDTTLPLSYSTNLTNVSARSTTLFDDMSFNIESLSDNEVTQGVIVFEPLTPAQRDTVMTFATTNKDIAFDFVNPNDGLTYTFYLTDPMPQSQLYANYQDPYYTVTYTVIGGV